MSISIVLEKDKIKLYFLGFKFGIIFILVIYISKFSFWYLCLTHFHILVIYAFYVWLSFLYDLLFFKIFHLHEGLKKIEM